MGYVVAGSGPKGYFEVEVATKSEALAEARLAAEGLGADVHITDPSGQKYLKDEFIALTVEKQGGDNSDV